MIRRRLGAAALAAILALGSAACDNNPLADDRDAAAKLFLSHAAATIEAGARTTVTANVLNQYGAPTGAAVTAQACDNRVTVAPDTARSKFENPERFVISGVSFGTSCVVISGGGLTDTVSVRVVPASVRLQRRDTLNSGETVQLAVQFLGATGQAVPGLTLAAAAPTFTVSDPAILNIDAQGNARAQAPGTAVVTVTFNQLGVTRTDSVRVTVVPGTFNGTVARGTAGAGEILTFTAGAIPFDANTQVVLNIPGPTQIVPSWFTLPGSSTTTIRRFLPYGIPAGTTISYDVINVGPNEVALRGTFTVTPGTPADDPLEPDLSLSTPKRMVPGDQFFGTISATDDEDLIRLTIAEAGTYRVQVEWNATRGDGSAGSDIDMYVLNSTASSVLLARETFADPTEVGNVTLQPGTYFIDLFMYAFVGGRPNTYRLTVTKL